MFGEKDGKLLGWVGVSEGDIGYRRGVVREKDNGFDEGVFVR